MKQEIVISQYRASLAMLRTAVEDCPDELWNRASDDNAFWQIAYHTLYYAHLYLSKSDEAFEAWPKHIEDYPHMGRLPWPPNDLPKIGDPYTKDDILEYFDYIDERIAGFVAAAPYEDPAGFFWLPFTRGELHFYNIRHIQHHAGQLIERLRQATGNGVDWVRSGS